MDRILSLAIHKMSRPRISVKHFLQVNHCTRSKYILFALDNDNPKVRYHWYQRAMTPSGLSSAPPRFHSRRSHACQSKLDLRTARPSTDPQPDSLLEENLIDTLNFQELRVKIMQYLVPKEVKLIN